VKHLEVEARGRFDLKSGIIQPIWSGNGLVCGWGIMKALYLFF